MPCNSDYLEPSLDEKNSARCINLLVFVHKKLLIPLPEWLEVIKLESYGHPPSLDRQVSLLCKLCTNMLQREKEAIIYNGRDKTSRDLADWWEEHMNADKIRLAKEAAEKKDRALRRRAIAKLSSEERRALGLRYEEDEP